VIVVVPLQRSATIPPVVPFQALEVIVLALLIVTDEYCLRR